eukprot:TRINITY_DN3137_c0_g3_i1.p1 TRINITY_DN3137_c0_g3~~TRINITY_DN3137_c0_g3_i1.p1  ORF type:complete len:227 (-),score=44.38 TRINITY_DN3137_c0_g3_i1:80-760(-)
MPPCRDEDVFHAETPEEEKWNVISHGIGVILSLIMLVTLSVISIQKRKIPSLVAGILYSLSMLVLFTASSIYHLPQWLTNHEVKEKLRRVDHLSIYLLIAGTYTPLCFGFVQKNLLTLVCIACWAITIFGIFQKLFAPMEGKCLSLSFVLYLLEGWLIAPCLPYLLEILNPLTIGLLLGGGLLYSIGFLVFFFWDYLPFNHVIWHVFVLGASICFDIAVLYQYLRI